MKKKLMKMFWLLPLLSNEQKEKIYYFMREVLIGEKHHNTIKDDEVYKKYTKQILGLPEVKNAGEYVELNEKPFERSENDPKTYGTLFFEMCDEIQDMGFVDAIKSLMKLFIAILGGFATENIETIKSKLKDWITSQSRFIQALFANLSWES